MTPKISSARSCFKELQALRVMFLFFLTFHIIMKLTSLNLNDVGEVHNLLIQKIQHFNK